MSLRLRLDTMKNMRSVFWKIKCKFKITLKENQDLRNIYHGEVVQVLEQIREIYGHICPKRLATILAEAIKVLERCKQIKNFPKTQGAAPELIYPTQSCWTR